MSVEKILEKVDAIEAQQVSKIEEAKAEVVKLVDEKVLSVEEKLSAIEAKLSEVQAPSIIKIEKTVRGDVNKMVREQLRDFAKSDAKSMDSILFVGCCEFTGNAQSRNITVEKGAVINAKLTTEKN